MTQNLSSITFLDDHLRLTTTTSTSTPPSSTTNASSPQSIIESWSHLRAAVQTRQFTPRHLDSLKTLIGSRGSVFVAEPQARVLVTIITDDLIRVPVESYHMIFRLLYVWARRAKLISSGFVEYVVDAVSRVFEKRAWDDSSGSNGGNDDNCSTGRLLVVSEGVLLLGGLSAVRGLDEGVKCKCLDLMCRVMEWEGKGMAEVVPEIVAGIGYSLASCGVDWCARIADILFGVLGRKEGLWTVSAGLMILHCMEWVVFGFINASSVEKIEVFVSVVLWNSEVNYAPSAVLMAAAGALRALSRSAALHRGMLDVVSRLRSSAEARLEAIAMDLMPRKDDREGTMDISEVSFLLQCFALAVARCGLLDNKRGTIFVCLALAMLNEIFPLQRIYLMILKFPLESLSAIELNVLKEHQDSVLFKEAGAVAGVLCNLYRSAQDDDKHIVENLIWDYCLDLYRGHRQVAFMLKGKADGLLSDLEKIAESVFLTVVVFALVVAKHRLTSKFSRDIKMRVSVGILISFSCVEYFRRLNVPEYLDTIKPVVTCVQEHEFGCEAFVASMPSYSELTDPRGFLRLPNTKYLWSQDEVQTARLLFYLRVIPTSVGHLPSTVFRTVVASTMFLYMGHHSMKVTRASHSVLVSFVSSTTEHDDERVQLKEQLVFYYMIRSLEVYPGSTPFEALASGVAAIVRNLPAGSPSIYYCINSLVNKVHALYQEVAKQEAKLSSKNLLGGSDPAKKIIGLLVQLLTLADVQVLSELMKLLAQLVAKLPKGDQTIILNDLYAMTAESDDVTRKPALISWLQSLSYLCSQDAAPITSRL
ncbi:hypothetical protein Droror1_Dr00027050 [Drosera rotundifolia]